MRSFHYQIYFNTISLVLQYDILKLWHFQSDLLLNNEKYNITRQFRIATIHRVRKSFIYFFLIRNKKSDTYICRYNPFFFVLPSLWRGTTVVKTSLFQNSPRKWKSVQFKSKIKEKCSGRALCVYLSSIWITMDVVRRTQLPFVR